MNFKELIESYESDSKVSKEEIQDKIYNIPILHGKYLKYLYQWRRKTLLIEKDLKELYRQKYEIYKNGDKVLDEKQIKFYIETDKEYLELNLRFQTFKIETEQIEQMVKHCCNLSFFYQNIMEVEKFYNGR